jgi:hypothetical protein
LFTNTGCQISTVFFTPALEFRKMTYRGLADSGLS